MSGSATTCRGASPGARFALTKFRPMTLPATLVTRPALHDRLTAGAGKRLTVVVGSAGAGKSVLLSSWVAARSSGATSWLSCDRADADPVRFWLAFIEAPRVIAPGFGADAADLLAMDGAMSADVAASIANDAAKLPTGSAVVVDDFHVAASAVSEDMSDLVERWPAGTAQLVLASRSDPALRLHRLRMADELCELRDRDLYFSLDDSRELLANFGVEVAADQLAQLHEGSEGWAAALQMAALSLRATGDPVRAARELDLRNHALAEYFAAEVLEQQPPSVAQFLLDTSVLDELTAENCAVLTRRSDAAVLLRGVDMANLFLVALDDERKSFRYHHLVRAILHAELRARDPAREQKLQLRAAEWFESTGDAQQAVCHFFSAQQADRALAVLQDHVMPDFLRYPAPPAALDLSAIPPALLAEAPGRLLALAANLLLSGDTARGGEYLDLFERTQPVLPPDWVARFAVLRSFHYVTTGQLDLAVSQALAARAGQERTPLTDDWNLALHLILLRLYNCREDCAAVEREAAEALAMPALTEVARLVLVPGARALAWQESGRLAEAADAAMAASADARRLRFSHHFFAVDHLRALAGLALERRDLDAADRFAEQALSITERRRPVFEFLTLLDRAGIWAARGQFREALVAVENARVALPGATPVLLARADELEGLIRLSLGDPRSAAELADRLPAARRHPLLAGTALACGDHRAAQEHVQAAPLDELTPRRALVRQILLAGAAIERGDPAALGVVGGVLQTARHEGFLNTVVTTAPQMTSYLVEHSTQLAADPFRERLIGAALEVRAAQRAAPGSGHMLAEPLTAAELRILKLLPTSSYLQLAATLYLSRNTVKTHLRSIYQKLGVSSRAEAIERAVDLCLL